VSHRTLCSTSCFLCPCGCCDDAAHELSCTVTRPLHVHRGGCSLLHELALHGLWLPRLLLLPPPPWASLHVVPQRARDGTSVKTDSWTNSFFAPCHPLLIFPKNLESSLWDSCQVY
jgi:hypothetical protein